MTFMKIPKLKDDSDKLFYIGGIVRDELLNRQCFDIDITYVGNALDYCRKFGEIIRENPDFATLRVNVRKEFLDSGKDTIVDFASTRSEIYPKKGHLPLICDIGCDLKSDVMRRDFTINAIAKSVKTGEIIDYTGGLKDLKNKKLKVLHKNSFIDDPTRIIRGLKFSVRFDFELDDFTKNLQDEYLENINYDISYKRLKKELEETFNLNSQKAFERFINDKIYKLVTPNKVVLPDINIEKFINEYKVEYVWLIYVAILKDLSKLPLTKIEQKIINDVPDEKFQNDLAIYRTFENLRVESIILYGILVDMNIAKRYLDKLRYIKIQITGEDLKDLGLKPSIKYKQIFDVVLDKKFKNPNMTKEEEIKIVLECIKKH